MKKVISLIIATILCLSVFVPITDYVEAKTYIKAKIPSKALAKKKVMNYVLDKSPKVNKDKLLLEYSISKNGTEQVDVYYNGGYGFANLWYMFKFPKKYKQKRLYKFDTESSKWILAKKYK